MKDRTWPILAAGFATLLLLTAILGVQTFRRSQQSYAEVFSTQEAFQSSQHTLNEIYSKVYLSSILVRDFLLDPSNLTAPSYYQELQGIRSSIGEDLEQLRARFGSQESALLQDLQQVMQTYWDSLDPLFDWTQDRKSTLSSLFLRKQVAPRRKAFLDLARRVRDLNEAHFKQEREKISQSQQEFLGYIGKMTTLTLSLGLMVAALGTYRITLLERRAQVQRKQTEQAERELRRLSQQLVRAQEDDRKSISRELHDEVGQMLTGLRMELANLHVLREGPESEFQEHLDDATNLAGEALQAIRDLAMGLRPSMLDDLGLGPALEWQARDFSRRSGVQVAVQIDGILDQLSDLHRTCVYRVVQEALTNCARHAQATDIRITLHGEKDKIFLTVQDDGVGFAPSEAPGRGLGLIGIEERVRELGGKVSIFSQPQKGALLQVEIPLDKETGS